MTMGVCDYVCEFVWSPYTFPAGEDRQWRGRFPALLLGLFVG
jgi:hypothetical protein